MVDGLKESMEELGPDNPFIKAILNRKTPEAVAKEVVTGSKLADPAVRKQPLEGSEVAVDASRDPAIELARKVDSFVRENAKWTEENVQSVVTAARRKPGTLTGLLKHK